MRTVFLFCLVLTGILTRTESTQKRYDGHQVLKVFPNILENFRNIEALGEKYKLDFWKHPKHINDTFDIHVTPEDVHHVIADLQDLGTNVQVWINDLQSLIDETKPSLTRGQRATSSMNLNRYHSYAEINAFLNSIAMSNTKTHLYKLGTSVQGRSINLIRFSTGTTSSGGHKKSIFIDGGIHAREWIATAVVLYLIDQLANNPNHDHDVTTLMDKFDWYFVPLVNPDGYEHTRSTDRMWRKNMAASYGTHHSSFGCGRDEMGVDLNRNFDYAWNPANGGSYDQCQEVYAGPRAESEPETRAMSHALDSVTSHCVAYLNTHSYGQYWIYPWGHSAHLPTDASDLDHLGRVASTALYGVNHHRYTVGEDAAVLYSAAGGADDYAKGHAHIKYAYTLELGDTGHYGFLLPERYIHSSGAEIWAGVKAMAHELARLYQL